MMRFRSLSTLAVGALALAALPLRAQDTTQRGVRIGLTYQAGTRPGIVVLPVRGPTGDSVRTILERDFDFGDRLTVVGGAGSAASDLVRATPAGPLNYDLFGRVGAAGIVQVTPTATGLHVALHDVAGKRVVQVEDFPVAAEPYSPAWRMAVHGVADEIERWITGRRGIAQTRIAFVRDKRLHVVDSDGANERAVGPGSSYSPAWHPSGRYVAVSTLGAAGSAIALVDLASGGVRPVTGGSGGLNITPAFSPDGETIVFAHGEEEGTDLFAVPAFGGGARRRISVGRGSDNVSPSFSPDGRRIAFTSGRSGHPEVYIMDADGTNAELLTPFAFGDQYYRSNPDWSPDGRLVAFQSQIGGRFQVMTIGLRDRAVRQLTSEGANEDPSWAPDGRHLVFTSTRTGVRQLFVLDTETGRVRQLTRGGGGARMSAWSRALGPSASAP